MTRRILPHGPTSSLANTVLALGEVAVDEGTDRIRIGDGGTLGGRPLAFLAEVNDLSNASEAAIAVATARIALVEGTVTSGRKGYAHYADAVADLGNIALNTLVEVPVTDTGTHHDPVTDPGSTGDPVPNQGVYRKEAGGLHRLYDVDAASASTFNNQAAASANAADMSADRAEGAAASTAVLVDQVNTGNRTDSVVVTDTTHNLRPESDFSGFGQTFTAAAEFTTNAALLDLVRGPTAKLWANVKVYLRTGTDPSKAHDDPDTPSTLIAVASLNLADPTQDILGRLFIPWRDPNNPDIFISPTIAAGATYGIMPQVFQADGTHASSGEQFATIAGAVHAKSYYVTTNNGGQDAWTLYSGNNVFAVAAINFDEINQKSVYLPTNSFLDAIGDTLSIPKVPPYADAGRMRQFRSFAARRMQKVPDTGLRYVYGLVGDSWSTQDTYMSQALANEFIAKFGDGGVGYIGFGFTGTLPTPSVNKDARGLYNVPFTGTGWTSNYHAGSTCPPISDARSSTVADTVTCQSISGATHPALSAVKLHFTGTADGVVQYRWNGASWTLLNLQGGVGAQQTASLTGFPTGALNVSPLGAITLDIQVVAGSVILGGVDFQSVSDGIVFHKLGAFGAKASDWILSLGTQWRAGVAALGLNGVQLLLGVNDQAAGVAASVFASQMAQIMQSLVGAAPVVDPMLIVPPETPAGYAVKMADYAAKLRAVAPAVKSAFLDLGPAFGDDPSVYASNGALPLFQSDNAHPEPRGRPLIWGEIERTLLWR